VFHPAAKVGYARAGRSLLLGSLLLFGCASDAGVRQGLATVNGTRLYYEQAGSGPDLVLLQGGQLDLRMWDAQFETFARHYRVLRYDVRGFGRSGPTGAPFQHHEDLAALLDELGIERAHFVGLSLGGRIAVDLELTHPERVRSLVLSGTGLSGFEWADDGSWAAIEEAVALGDARGAAAAWLRHPYMVPAMERVELRGRLEQLVLDNSRVWVREASELPLTPPALVRLYEVRAPTLRLVGTRDVPDIQRIAALLEQDVPDLVRVDVEGGHLLNLEAPARFDALVLEFLASGGAVVTQGRRQP